MDGERDELRNGLWHASAGPQAYTPQVGDKVFYFVQGHVEQVAAHSNLDVNFDTMPDYMPPSKILCIVVDVQPKAERITDEVFAQITLVPEAKQEWSKTEDVICQTSEPSHVKVFNKILTKSDTGEKGGFFTVPVKMAKECLPPLDMSQEVPEQELVATDIHGNTWSFRHILRGTPKRHLLTKGWHEFVKKKQLVVGDMCVFLRGQGGELGVGVRRALRKDSSHTAIMSSQGVLHGILGIANHALLYGTIFTVLYYPWTRSSSFIIPYNRYMKSVQMQCSVGTRFKMGFEREDTKIKSPTGKVMAIDDLDSARWPGSEWKRLQVEWEGVSDKLVRPTRISSWNIDSLEPKRRRNTFKTSPPSKKFCPPDLPCPTFSASLLAKYGHSNHDGFQRQENRVSGAYGASCSTSVYPAFPVLQSDKQIRKADQPFQSSPQGRSSAFPVCLPSSSTTGNNTGGNSNTAIPNADFLSLGLQEMEEYQEQNEVNDLAIKEKRLEILGLDGPPEFPSPQPITSVEFRSRRVPPITSQIPDTNNYASETSMRMTEKLCNNCRSLTSQSDTKVRKYDNAASITINLSRFSCYDGLIRELDKIFEFNGKLIDGSTGWIMTYIDQDDDLMLIGGDYPFERFMLTVKELLICPKENLDKRPPSFIDFL